MKVIICQINSKFVHSSLAAWCLFSGIRNFAEESHTAEVVEGTVNETIQRVVERIVDKEPDVVGFCCYIWNISFVKEVSAYIKSSLPQCKIIFGGPEVSYNAEQVLKESPFADFVISGEGELPFAMLLDGIARGDVPSGFGICRRLGSQVIVEEPYISYSEPPSPYCEEYFDTLGGRMVYFETSRGCPYSCAFCLSGRCGGVRYFDLNRVKKELILLANSGTQTIKFVDRTFNADKNRAKEIVRFIISEYDIHIPHSVCFHFEIAGDILDDELISLLTEAPRGLFQLEIGMQSFNEKTLSSINRKTNCEVLKKNILMLTNAKNMHIHIDLIAGLPHEDLESFKNSFNTAYSLNSDMLQLGFLKLLYGADMREKPEKYPCVFSDEPPYEVMQTPYLSKEDLALLKGIEEILDRTYNSGRFKETLEYALSLCQTPFELFERLSNKIKIAPKIGLDEFTQQLFTVLNNFEGVDCKLLRDLLVCDRICSSADGRLPSFLKVSDPFLKTAKHFLEKKTDTKQKKGVRRSVALLYSERSVVWCDYISPDPVTGRYLLHKIPFEDVIKFCD